MPEWIERFDGRLDVSPPLTDEQLEAIPAKRGVFALLASGERPIVLLTGADLRARLRTRLAEPMDDRRRKAVDLRAIAATVLWKLTYSHFETDLEFLETAMRIWPETYAELVAWRPPWFVCVDPSEAHPHFARARDPRAGSGLHVGPFPDGRSADRFIEAVQDAFGLCRDLRCLRQAPNGPRCAYAEMNRCLSPCDGTISLADYRGVVAAAAEFAAGRRGPLRNRLEREMKRAAAKLEFEEAAALKTRLGRLEEFDKPAYRLAEPLERFRFVLVQPGRTRRGANVFLACGGRVARADPLDYPLKDDSLNAVLERMAAVAAEPTVLDEAARWRMGLVAQYLFSGEQRRGVMLRWDSRLSPGKLRRAVEAAAGHLRLHAPEPRTPAGRPSKSSKRRPPRPYNAGDGRRAE